MKRLLILFMFLTASASAQTTTVTGTITDPQGNPYQNGTASAQKVVSSGQNPGPPFNTTTNAAGLFSFSGLLALPSPASYIFTICAAPANIGPKANPTPTQLCFSNTLPIAISGASQDVSTTLNALAPTLGPSLSNIQGANNNFTGNNSFVNLTVSGTQTTTGAGIFNNTQMNETMTSSLNGLNFGTEYSGQQGGNFATEALAGGVTVPGASTVHQVNGVSGYMRDSSTTTFGVGIYGQGVAGAVSGVKAEGGNLVVADTSGSAASSLTGLEVDVNVNNVATPAFGYTVNGGWSAQPTTANALLVQTLNGTFHWINGLVFNGNATNNSSGAALLLNQSGSGAGQDSQQIIFNSSTKGGGILTSETNGGVSITNGGAPPLAGPLFASKMRSSGTGTGTSAPFTSIASGQVGYAWKDTSQAVDAKLWDIAVGIDANTMRFRMVNDAESTAVTWLTATRSGTALNALSLGTFVIPIVTDQAVGRATVDTLTNKTLNVPLTSGTGLQIFNTTTTCTTAASVGATCTTAAISLPVAEADANYRITCTGKGPTAVPVVSSIANSSATQFTLTIAALTAVAASFASYDCIAGHN